MPNTDLPDEIREPAAEPPQDEPKLDRRTAIAQARAIRREAAAMDESIKAQAAETASTILEQAEPEPPKAPLHKQTAPQPVSNATGKFGWLDEVSPQEPERSSTHTDTDALLAELRAESRARAKQSEPVQTDAPADTAEASRDDAEYTGESGDDAAYDGEYDDDAEYAGESGDDAEYDGEYNDDAEYAGEYDDDAEYDGEYDDEAAYGDTPEEQVIRELRVMDERAPMRSQRAAAEYRAVSDEARPFVRKRAKEAEKQWKKEAGSRRAEETIRRTERTTAKWNIGICLLLLFGIAIYNLVLERPVKSMKENRMLAKMPAFSTDAYLSGKYTSGVELYYNDTVPHRDDFKEMTQIIRKHMGLSGSTVLVGDLPTARPQEDNPAETTAPPVTTADAAVTAQTLTTVSAAVTTTTAPESDEPEREGEMGDNGVLIVNKRGIMLFGGWETMGENYAHILSRFKESAPDINMYSMVIPTVCSFYMPEEYQHLIASEKANIDYINKTLVGVIPVDVYGALEKHKDEKIFMRTDHHWSSLGAFYACEAFSADARVPFARIEEYDRKTKDGYVGTLYTFSNNIILKENPEEFFWYVPHAHFTTTFYNNSFGNPREGDYFMNIDNVAPVSYYMVYMSGDDHIVRVQTDVHNGRRLCIIKDSYGNALAPWLTSSFEEIYIIDMRYFELNAISFLREHGVTDVLFAMNSFSANGDNGAKVEKIRTQ